MASDLLDGGIAVEGDLHVLLRPALVLERLSGERGTVGLGERGCTIERGKSRRARTTFSSAAYTVSSDIK